MTVRVVLYLAFLSVQAFCESTLVKFNDSSFGALKHAQYSFHFSSTINSGWASWTVKTQQPILVTKRVMNQVTGRWLEAGQVSYGANTDLSKTVTDLPVTINGGIPAANTISVRLEVGSSVTDTLTVGAPAATTESVEIVGAEGNAFSSWMYVKAKLGSTPPSWKVVNGYTPKYLVQVFRQTTNGWVPVGNAADIPYVGTETQQLITFDSIPGTTKYEARLRRVYGGLRDADAPNPYTVKAVSTSITCPNPPPPMDR